LKRLYAKAGITPREGLRAKEPLAQELGLTRPDVTDDEVLDAMAEHPILIERPLVETPNGVRLCRPQDRVREIL
jgi:arsenate reductase